MILLDSLNGLANIRHGFFTRVGGISDGIYAGKNCGFGSGDDPDNVARNRARCIAEMADGVAALVTAYQVHSSAAAVVEAPWQPKDAPQVDGLVTDRPNIALGILTADCAPILFADSEAGVIGAAHAGWKGASGGILEATVLAMESLGAAARRIVAAVGPCIAQASYEVGPEFRDRFLAQDRANDRFFQAGRRPGHPHFDLKGYVVAQLDGLGLAGIEADGHDTVAEEELFFSYRRATLRGEDDYGRGLSAIMIES